MREGSLSPPASQGLSLCEATDGDNGGGFQGPRVDTRGPSSIPKLYLSRQEPPPRPGAALSTAASFVLARGPRSASSEGRVAGAADSHSAQCTIMHAEI